ncbi:MAG: hypothetical protein ABIH47_02845, partial [Candidatus Omnitrophota bacterium]
LERKDSQKVLTSLQGVIAEGKDLRQFNKGLLQIFRDILMTKTTKSPEKMIERLPESIKELQKKGTLFTVEDLLYIITILQNLLNQIRYASSPQIYTEIALVKLTSREEMVPLEMLIDRLDGLKNENDKGGTISTTMNMPSLHSHQERESSQSKDIQSPEGRIQQKVEGYLKTQQQPDKIDTAIEASEQKQTKSITLTMIEEQWTNILNEVKKKRMSLGVFLSEAEPIDVEEDVLVVGFPSEFAFHKETVATIDNKRSVEAAIENIMKTPLRISYVVTKKDVREEVLDAALDNGHHSKIVESAVNIFHGKPVRKRG